MKQVLVKCAITYKHSWVISIFRWELSTEIRLPFKAMVSLYRESNPSEEISLPFIKYRMKPSSMFRLLAKPSFLISSELKLFSHHVDFCGASCKTRLWQR